VPRGTFFVVVGCSDIRRLSRDADADDAFESQRPTTTTTTDDRRRATGDGRQTTDDRRRRATREKGVASRPVRATMMTTMTTALVTKATTMAMRRDRAPRAVERRRAASFARGGTMASASSHGDGHGDGPSPSSRETAAEARDAREAQSSGVKPTTTTTTTTGDGKGAKNGELNIPMESASARKRVGRTRLLRTPMAGGVVSRDTKDRNLPSMATAARNLMELADYGDLSTTMSDMHHRRAGYPFGSTVDFATDATGHPIFCLAPLAIHTRNIAADSRCSLTVKMSGWGGLANARVTIFGDVQKLPSAEYQTAANEIFKAKYHARKEAIDMEDRWGDYTFYRMNRIVDVYFVGGFGTLNWIKLDEYMNTSPDTIVTSQNGRSVTETLSELNTRFAQRLAKHMSDALDLLVDDLWIISIDRRGMDVRVRTDGSSLIRRITFEVDVENFDDAAKAIDCALASDNICSTEF